MLDAGTSCALSLHLMLTSSVLQHSFDVSVAIQAAHNLLAANWVGVRVTAFVQSYLTGVSFEPSGWNFQCLSRIDWATNWHWQQFFCNFSSRIWWQLRIILDQTMYESRRSHQSSIAGYDFYVKILGKLSRINAANVLRRFLGNFK